MSLAHGPDAPTFIETQFPVSRLSKESYKERKANYSQTLTGLGKWWGRKPLILVRAVILGLLLPASSDPRKDREVFLALLTMDDEGLRRRKSRNIPLKEMWRRFNEDERRRWFTRASTAEAPKLKAAKAATKRQMRARMQAILFERMSYDEKLRFVRDQRWRTILQVCLPSQPAQLCSKAPWQACWSRRS